MSVELDESQVTSTSHDAWGEIVGAALLGTERRGFSPPSTDGALGDLLARLDTSQSEGALLSAASVVALHRLAGQVPIMATQPLLEPCEADELRPCSPRSTQHLKFILSESHTDLIEVLVEWFDAAREVGRRVSDECLPAVLERGRMHTWLANRVLAMVGKRGVWLAAQNPAWDYVMARNNSDPRATWETGSRLARLALMEWLRVEGGPHVGRELLQETWADESGPDREAFLALFQQGLSMEDEPFLEMALDDRSKEVRRIASVLLSVMPESGLVKRMVERLTPLLNIKSGPMGLASHVRPHIEVVFPEAPDKDLERDGVARKSLHASKQHFAHMYTGLGEKAMWLFEMIISVPPSTWCKRWSMSPSEIVEACGRSEEAALLKKSLIIATWRNSDPEWAEALLTLWPWERDFVDLSTLMWSLSPERREAFVIAKLESREHRFSQLLPLIGTCVRPQSERLSRAVLDTLRRHVGRDMSPEDHFVRSYVLKLGYSLHSSLADEAASEWPTEANNWHFWARAVQELQDMIRFRHDMLRELQA